MNERERDRNAARRLAIIRHAQEVTGNVAGRKSFTPKAMVEEKPQRVYPDANQSSSLTKSCS